MNAAHKPIAPYIVAGIVTAFLVFLAYMLFFVPKMNESKALVDQAATAHTNNAALISKADKLAAIAKNVTPLQNQVAAFNKAFPEGASQQDLIAAFTAAASANGVTLTGLNPTVPAAQGSEAQKQQSTAPATQQQPEGTNLPGAAPIGKGASDASAAAPSPLAAVTVTVNATGSEPGLEGFVAAVESMKRPFKVSDMQIEKVDKGFHLMLKGDTYLVAPLTAPDAAQQ